MVDVKPGPHAEHVNPMPHGGFDVAYHIPILDNPAKEPTHAVSPCAIAAPRAYGNGVTSAYPFERCVVVERSARKRYPPSPPPTAWPLADWSCQSPRCRIEMTSAVLLRTLRILLLPLSSHRSSALFVLPLGPEQTVVGLLFDGANARWAAWNLDLAGHLQRLAIEAQHVERLVKHGLRQQRLAIPAPDHPLSPASHLRLGRECELASLDAVDYDDAMIVVGWVGLWFVRAVLDHHRHVRAVGREGDPFGDLANRMRLHDMGWVLLQIDDTDDVGIALAAALIGEHGEVAPGADRDAVGTDAGDHVGLGVLHLRAVDRQHRNAVIAVAGDERTLAVGEEGHVARAGLGVAELNRAGRCQGLAVDGEDRHRAIPAI